MGEGLNGEGNRREIRLYQPDEKQPTTRTMDRGWLASWSARSSICHLSDEDVLFPLRPRSQTHIGGPPPKKRVIAASSRRVGSSIFLFDFYCTEKEPRNRHQPFLGDGPTAATSRNENWLLIYLPFRNDLGKLLGS
jgi:hypothetical protein